MNKKHIILILLVFTLMIWTTGCKVEDDKTASNNLEEVANEDTSSDADSNEVDQEENKEDPNDKEELKLLFEEDQLPEVVIIINGQKITKGKILAEYEQMKTLYSQVGADINDNDIKVIMQESLLSNTINTTIFQQEADKEGIIISDATIDERIEEIKSQYQDDKEFDQMLIKLDIKIGEFKETVRNQLKTSKFLYKKIGELLQDSDYLEFSEEDKKRMYLMFSSKMGDMPDYDNVQDELDVILKENKIQVIVQEYLNDLIDNSEIELYLGTEE